MGIESLPNPSDSPLEKLEIARRTPSPREFASYLRGQGVDPALSEKIGRAVQQWESEKFFDEVQALLDLERWSNIHTHPAAGGGTAYTLNGQYAENTAFSVRAFCSRQTVTSLLRPTHIGFKTRQNSTLAAGIPKRFVIMDDARTSYLFLTDWFTEEINGYGVTVKPVLSTADLPAGDYKCGMETNPGDATGFTTPALNSAGLRIERGAITLPSTGQAQTIAPGRPTTEISLISGASGASTWSYYGFFEIQSEI